MSSCVATKWQNTHTHTHLDARTLMPRLILHTKLPFITDATVTSAPNRVRVSVIQVVSTSSDPSPMGTRTFFDMASFVAVETERNVLLGRRRGDTRAKARPSISVNVRTARKIERPLLLLLEVKENIPVDNRRLYFRQRMRMLQLKKKRFVRERSLVEIEDTDANRVVILFVAHDVDFDSIRRTVRVSVRRVIINLLLNITPVRLTATYSTGTYGTVRSSTQQKEDTRTKMKDTTTSS